MQSKSTSIAATTSPTANVIGEYISQSSSTADGYDAGYFVIQITDTTNGSYSMSELLVVDDYILADDTGDTYDTGSYGDVGTSGIGTIGTKLVADSNAGVATVQ